MATDDPYRTSRNQCKDSVLFHPPAPNSALKGLARQTARVDIRIRSPNTKANNSE